MSSYIFSCGLTSSISKLDRSSKYFLFVPVLGETTRKGFYSYGDKRRANPDPELKKYIEKSRSISGVAIDPKVSYSLSLYMYIYKIYIYMCILCFHAFKLFLFLVLCLSLLFVGLNLTTASEVIGKGHRGDDILSGGK